MLTSHSWTDWSCAVDVTVEEQSMALAIATVQALMAEVSLAASRFRDDSDISRINAASGRYVSVSPLTIELVDVAIDVARTTAGCVDPMVGADLIAAGYDADIEVLRARTAPPSRGPVAPRATWEVVQIDRLLGRIGIPVGTQLDLGATAKAWATEECAARVARRIGTPTLVGIGGDLAMYGDPSGGWRVDVSELRGEPVEELFVSDGAMTTSSTIGRRFLGPDGSDRHHLIDPRTGAAAESPWRTATVWAPSAVAANALTTWALVDAAAAEEAIQAQDLAARFVAHDGSVSYFGTWAPPSEVAR